MLVAFVSRRHAFQLRRLGERVPEALRGRVRLVPYETACYRLGLPGGAYVFTNVEALESPTFERACGLAEAIRDTDPDAIILNDPRGVMRRYEFLRTLYREGINSFDCSRVDEGRAPQRWPVFVRGECDHRGGAPTLLQDARELAAALADPGERRRDRTRRLIVEFVDTRPAGDPTYRKYGAFRVGSEIFAAHVNFNEHWMVKLKRDPTPDEAVIQSKYIEANPHKDKLRSIFDLAGIQYGRIDYGVGEHGIEVWEINTNPTLVNDMYESLPRHWEAFFPVVKRVAHALAALADQGEGRPEIPSAALRALRPRYWRRLRRYE